MKILIGLIEHIGDVVACEPVARYLRIKHPDAHLAWAIQKPYRELIDVNPNVDETIAVDCLTDWIKLSRHNKNAHNGFDLIVDLHVNYRVCEQCRVPLVKEYGNPFVNAYEWLDYGALLEAFSQGAGLPKLTAQPRMYIQEKHRIAVDALQLPSQFCVIHRESSSAVKDWPNEKWHTLITFIETELSLPVVEVGSTKNQGQPAGAAAIDLLNRTTLLETAEVIRRARFYVGIDSGPAHFANAVETPGVVLLGRVGYFRQYSPFTGFYASRSPLVRLVRNLTGVVAEIPVEEVIEATRYVASVLREQDSQGVLSPRERPSFGTAAPGDESYRQMVLESGLFDPGWYVVHYPEAAQNGYDPLDHFIMVGAKRGDSPGADFDARWYTSQRQDLVVVTDPLEHYLYFGKSEGLQPRPGLAAVSEACPGAEAMASTLAELYGQFGVGKDAPESGDELPRIFAFYLPQFHPTPENNQGHRPGFTEWDNVIKAKPLFKGHYQPRIPGELGYYDLRAVDVMREQVRLANDHGITGFCFYYYYFHGKKLLYKPIDNYIRSDIQAPFFFLWANENWSRRWDGGDNEVIISQNHSAADDLLFIRELLPVFADQRYAKIGGKPILGVYKTHLFPDIKRSTDLWRDEVEKNGFPGIYLVMVDDWSEQTPHPRSLGFDASYEIPSNIVPEQVLATNTRQLGMKEGFQGRIVDYRKFASFHMGRPFPDYKRFRTVMAPWDNTPRYGSRAMVQINTENDAYKLWLAQALIDTHRRYGPDERIVLLHSWNEWCEGTYIEPDGRNGRRLLEETKEVVDELRSMIPLGHAQTDPKTLIHLHSLMRAKDEGAARSLQALRQQNMYVHRELEHQRAQVKKLSQAAVQQAAAHASAQAAAQAAAEATARDAMLAVEEVRQRVHESISWRITKPLRALGRLLKT